MKIHLNDIEICSYSGEIPDEWKSTNDDGIHAKSDDASSKEKWHEYCVPNGHRLRFNFIQLNSHIALVSRVQRHHQRHICQNGEVLIFQREIT